MGTLPSELPTARQKLAKANRAQQKPSSTVWGRWCWPKLHPSCIVTWPDRRQPRRTVPSVGLHSFRLDKRKFPFV